MSAGEQMSETNPGARATPIDTVMAVLERIGWDAASTDIEGVFCVEFDADDAPVERAVIEVHADVERFILACEFRERAPSEYRVAAIECVARANFGLAAGCFEIDCDTGLVRFRSGLDFTGVELTLALVRNVIASSQDAIAHYADALSAVISGKLTAREAIAAADRALEQRVQ